MTHNHSFKHFTGAKKSDSSKKKAKKNRTNTKKARRQKRGSAKSKYSHLVSGKDKRGYNKEDKRHRRLPIFGHPGEIKPVGTVIIFHERRYVTKEEVEIPASGEIYVDCKLI